MLYNMDKKPSLLTLALLISLAAVGALFFHTRDSPHGNRVQHFSPRHTVYDYSLSRWICGRPTILWSYFKEVLKKICALFWTSHCNCRLFTLRAIKTV